MRLEVHVHADIPILEGVSKRQLEQAFAPLLEYLDADGLSDVKSLEADEPGIKYDEKELLLTVCWTGEIGRSFHGALDAALENLGPYCYEPSRSTSPSTTRTASRSPSSCSSARRRARSTRRSAAA